MWVGLIVVGGYLFVIFGTLLLNLLFVIGFACWLVVYCSLNRWFRCFCCVVDCCVALTIVLIVGVCGWLVDCCIVFGVYV